MARKKESGQAMPLGIALLMVGVLVGLVLYNTGQSASTKARLANTADAAAYSGLQWQARALNFAGYTNRAMVANQVSLAQAVTLTSWSTYGMIMSENIARVLSAIPVINAIAQGASTVMVTVNSIINPIAQAMLSVIDGVNRGVGIAQNAMYQSSYLATPEIVMAVVEQSDPSFTAGTAYSMGGLVDNLVGWRAFSDKVSDDESDHEHMRERASIIRDSQDAFTRSRNWSFFDGFLYLGPFLKVDLIKDGETRLIEQEGANGLEWEWKSKDNMSFHTKVRIPWRGWRGAEIPIGYGMAVANTINDVTLEEGACIERSEMSDCLTWSEDNETSESLADVDMTSLNGSNSREEMSGFSGLSDFRRLSESAIEDTFPTVKLRVEVETDATDVRNSTEFTNDEIFRTPNDMPGSAMSAISIAEVYFKPPVADHESEQGQEIEFANLYSPWWDVRLAPVPAADRLAAFTLRAGSDGLSALPNIVPGEENGASGTDGHGGDISGEGTASTATNAALASALGMEGTSATDAVMEGAMNAAEDFGEDLVDSARDMIDEAVDGAEAQIREALAEALEDAVRQILNGIVSDATGGVVDADDLIAIGEDMLGDAEEDSAEITENIDAARTEVEAMQAEFERLDRVVNERFSDVFAAELDAYEQRTQGLRSTLSGYLGRRVGLFERLNSGVFPDSQQENVERFQERLNTFIADLSVAYRDIVNEETDQFEMTYEMARDYVMAALASYEANEGEIDWSLFGGEEVDESDATPEGEDNGESVGETTAEATDG